MTQHSVHHQIETDIARNRADLASTLAALRQRAAPEAMTTDAMGLFARQAEHASGVVDRVMRANPVAFVLMGAGLAWIVWRGRQPESAIVPEKLVVMSSWEDDGGPARPSDERVQPPAGTARPSGHIIGDHPLIAGAVVMALGAAIGAAFPPRSPDNVTG